MIGVIGAMDSEILGLASLLGDKREITISGFTFSVGKIGSTDVVCAKSGVGKVFSAICAQTMILQFGVKKIINTGIAGAMSPTLKVGDLAISSGVCQHDMDTSGVGDPVGMVSGVNKIYFDADPDLVQLANRAAKDFELRAETGIIASGDQFVCDKSRKKFIQENFHPIAVEMEGAAIGQACYINKVPFVVLRVISDDASGMAPTSYKEFFLKASQTSVLLTERLLSLSD